MATGTGTSLDRVDGPRDVDVAALRVPATA